MDKNGNPVPPADQRSVRLFWLAALCMVPLLAGGVLVGDEALLLQQFYQYEASGKAFGAFARTPGFSYIFHHLLWFSILSLSSRLLALATSSLFLQQAVIAAETVAAALAAVALCYTFIIRRMRLGIARSLVTVLGFFAAGYGVFICCGGGNPEPYMALAMAARLFFFEPEVTPKRAWKLAAVDVVLIAFKPYSLIFIAALSPLLWKRATPHARGTYLAAFTILLAIFAAAKLWVWNVPGTYGEVAQVSAGTIVRRLLQEIASPWTGLLFCMPVLLVLFWHRPQDRVALFFKLAALACCLVFFAFFSFFDGDVPGGRYIFPYLIVLMPEIAQAVSRLLDRHPRAAWLLIPAMLLFLPAGAISFPFYPNNAFPTVRNCTPLHPGIYAWRVIIANLDGQEEIAICFRHEQAVLRTEDASSPRPGALRVAYLLRGGHSNGYRVLAHGNEIQQQHDSWGRVVAQRLGRAGLGSPLPWHMLGLLPALLALGTASAAAWRLNHRQAKA